MSTARYGLTQSIAPAEEPLTTAEAKAWARINQDEDDQLVGVLITAAREFFERDTGRVLVNSTYVQKWDRYPAKSASNTPWSHSGEGFTLARGPVVSVTSIQFIDGNGDTQTESASVYDVLTDREPGRIALAHGQSWNTPREQAEAVIVTYVAGHGATKDSVPARIKLALRMMIAHTYNNRDTELTREKMTGAINSTLDLWKIW